jgi:hypothetical protein
MGLTPDETWSVDPAPPPPAPPLLLRALDSAELSGGVDAGRIDDALIFVRAGVSAPAKGTSALTRLASVTWVVEAIDYQDQGSPAPWLGDLGAEWDVPHPTFDLAQPLVGAAPAMIGGVVRPGEGPDFFHIPDGTAKYRVSVLTTDPDSRMADRLYLYDEAGRLVGEWTLPWSAAGMSIELRPSDFEDALGLYVGIGPAEDATEKHPEESYVLQIEPIAWDTSSDEPPSPSGGSDPEPDTPVGAPVLVPGPGPQGEAVGGSRGPAMPEDPAPPADIAAESVTIPQGATPGPLPALEAAPFGGVFASGDPLPVLGDDRGASVDLTLIDLPAGSSSIGSEEEATGPIEAEHGMVEVADDGRLPHVAASLPRAPADPEALDRVIDILASQDAAPIEGEVVAIAAAAPCSGGEKDVQERRRALPAAIGLATALAVTMALPDLVPQRYEFRPSGRLPAWLRRLLGLPPRRP